MSVQKTKVSFSFFHTQILRTTLTYLFCLTGPRRVLVKEKHPLGFNIFLKYLKINSQSFTLKQLCVDFFTFMVITWASLFRRLALGPVFKYEMVAKAVKL